MWLKNLFAYNQISKYFNLKKYRIFIKYSNIAYAWFKLVVRNYDKNSNKYYYIKYIKGKKKDHNFL